MEKKYTIEEVKEFCRKAFEARCWEGTLGLESMDEDDFEDWFYDNIQSQEM